MVLFRRDSEGGPAPRLLRVSPLRQSGRGPPAAPRPPPAPLGMPPAAWATRDPDLKDEEQRKAEAEWEAEEESIAVKALITYEENLKKAEGKSKCEENRAALHGSNEVKGKKIEEAKKAMGGLKNVEGSLKKADGKKSGESRGEEREAMDILMKDDGRKTEKRKDGQEREAMGGSKKVVGRETEEEKGDEEVREAIVDLGIADGRKTEMWENEEERAALEELEKAEEGMREARREAEERMRKARKEAEEGMRVAEEELRKAVRRLRKSQEFKMSQEIRDIENKSETNLNLTRDDQKEEETQRESEEMRSTINLNETYQIIEGERVQWKPVKENRSQTPKTSSDSAERRKRRAVEVTSQSDDTFSEPVHEEKRGAENDKSLDLDETFFSPAERQKHAEEQTNIYSQETAVSVGSDETFFSPAEMQTRADKRSDNSQESAVSVSSDETYFSPAERQTNVGKRNIYSQETTVCSEPAEKLRKVDIDRSIFSQETTVCSEPAEELIKVEIDRSIYSEETVIYDMSEEEQEKADGEGTIYSDETFCEPSEEKQKKSGEKRTICSNKTVEQEQSSVQRDQLSASTSTYPSNKNTMGPAKHGQWEVQENLPIALTSKCYTNKTAKKHTNEKQWKNKRGQPIASTSPRPLKKIMRRTKEGQWTVQENLPCASTSTFSSNITVKGLAKQVQRALQGDQLSDSTSISTWVRSTVCSNVVQEDKKANTEKIAVKRTSQENSPLHVCKLPRCEEHQPFYVSSKRELGLLPEHTRHMARREGLRSPPGFWSLNMPSTQFIRSRNQNENQ